MAFALTFLIAAIIGIVIADGVSRTSDDEIEAWKKEDESQSMRIEDKDIIGNIWIPSQKAISDIKFKEDEDE